LNESCFKIKRETETEREAKIRREIKTHIQWEIESKKNEQRMSNKERKRE
jgi:hypothetical protein